MTDTIQETDQFDTRQLIPGINVTRNEDDTIDYIEFDLNYLEDFFGRYNNTIEDSAAKAEIIGRMFSYAKMSRDDFLAAAKKHIGREDDSLFDRFLGQVHGYLTSIDTVDVTVIDFRLGEQILDVYTKIIKDFETLRTTRFIKHWPHEIPDDQELEDF